MAEIQLVAESGRAAGSRQSRRLRRDGRIPGVVYGHGIDPISVSVDARELRAALSGESGSRALLQLRIGSTRHLAVARQLQRHPVRHTVSHVDFQVVSRDEVISGEIPVTLVGDAVAVHRGDGTVSQEITALLVRAKPADMPPQIEVDISGLEIGHSVRVKDIELPAGVQTDLDPENVVVIGQAPQIRLPEEEAVEGAEEEGAPEAAEEGAAASGEEASGAEGAGGS
jgi:large subunit ribosomal protein L25